MSDNAETREQIRGLIVDQIGWRCGQIPDVHPRLLEGIEAAATAIAALPPVAGPEVRPDETGCTCLSSDASRGEECSHHSEAVDLLELPHYGVCAIWFDDHETCDCDGPALASRAGWVNAALTVGRAALASPAPSPGGDETLRAPELPLSVEVAHVGQVPITLDPDLEHRGICDWNFQYDLSMRPSIRLREYDERVLLHEILHALIGTDPAMPRELRPGADGHEELVRRLTRGLFGMGWRWKVRDRTAAQVESELSEHLAAAADIRHERDALRAALVSPAPAATEVGEGAPQ